ncbi:hypothetical protein BpHYR1_039842 [Brachionus plicatilis]|uniref:Uncharacterized protein n=1 Tax=Brachionus plicatilis TaxID=10195 RepID=A0A3M7S8P6_BRAPC|nr:hypothetical protein BpHYR1_039842 [Brachionus plicatilis]
MATGESTNEICYSNEIINLFFSSKADEKLKDVPKIVQKIKCDIEELKTKTKDLEKIDTEFKDLICLFNKIHNLNMSKPDLKKSIRSFRVLEDALSNDKFDDNDKKDCTNALGSLSDVIIKLQNVTENALKENNEFDNQIKKLIIQIGKKREVIEGRNLLRNFKISGALIAYQAKINNRFFEFKRYVNQCYIKNKFNLNLQEIYYYIQNEQIAIKRFLGQNFVCLTDLVWDT